MKVKNKISGEIIEMTQSLFNRNKKFFTPIVDEIKKKKSLEELKKSDLISLILEKYKDYSEEDLKSLKKDVLIMTYKGELE